MGVVKADDADRNSDRGESGKDIAPCSGGRISSKEPKMNIGEHEYGAK